MHRPDVASGDIQSFETVTSAAGGNDKFGSENEMPPAVADVASMRVVAVTSAMRFIVRSFQSELDFQISKPIGLVAQALSELIGSLNGLDAAPKRRTLELF
jgi:hypothetical protein